MMRHVLAGALLVLAIMSVSASAAIDKPDVPAIRNAPHLLLF